ncbi:MAG TPA: GAF domain-containing protein [Candidatus Acidoferrales bacterium]|nr:GAF domain-containing protein [Candidatus Acidoferrales bacterium]
MDDSFNHRKSQNRPNHPGDVESLLLGLAACVSGPGTRTEKLRKAANALRQGGGYRWVGLYDVDHVRGVVSNMVWDGPSPPAHPVFPADKGLTGRAIRTRAAVNVGDVASDPDYLNALGDTRSEIIVPVLDSRGSVAGTIDIESEHRDAFTLEAQKLLERCAAVIRPLWTRSGRH